MYSQKKEINILLIKIFVFLLVVFSLDFLVGYTLKTLYFKTKSGLYYRTNYGLLKTNASLLIFGSSSANHHYVPKILEDSTKLSVYNQGRDGIEILYCTAIFKGVLKRYIPRVVLLNLSPNELSNKDRYDRLAALLPYISKYPDMKDFVKLRGKYEKIKMISKIYPYNSTVFTIINGIITQNTKKQIDQGFVPLYDTMKIVKTNIPLFFDEAILDSNRVNAFQEFIDLNRKNNIKLYVIFSPWFSPEIKETATTRKVEQICIENQISLYNFICDTSFSKSVLFADGGHLNVAGASVFTQIIAHKIK
jgi:hypothetical protein